MKDVSRSGTSSGVVTKAEKSLGQYNFLKWLDDFTQARQGRSNLPSKNVDSQNENFSFTEGDSLDDAFDVVSASSEHGVDSHGDENEIITENSSRKQAKKLSATEMVSNKRPGIKGSAKEIIDDMEFSLISKLNEQISEKRKDNEEVFCKSLALDLRDLPPYERCIAKQEMRNVIFKHQMSVMSRQMHQNIPQNSVFEQQDASPIFSSPPITPKPWGQ